MGNKENQEISYVLRKAILFFSYSMLYLHWNDFVFVSWILVGKVYISLEINPLL